MIGLVFAAVVGLQAPTWEDLGTLNNGEAQISVRSYEGASALPRVWMRFDYARPKEGVMTLVYLEEMDCGRRLSRTVSVTSYTGADMGGNSSTRRPNEDWTDPVPGTVAEAVWKYICDFETVGERVD